MLVTDRIARALVMASLVLPLAPVR